jgi:hypothetical protein
MDKVISTEVRERILDIARQGKTSDQATGYFRVALGLYYLDGVMVEEELDFKAIDRNVNKFIYQSIGKGHSITSILQYMSGKEVVKVLESRDFLNLFASRFPEIPMQKIPLLMSVNLKVAKKISGLPNEGAVKDWIGWQLG